MIPGETNVSVPTSLEHGMESQLSWRFNLILIIINQTTMTFTTTLLHIYKSITFFSVSSSLISFSLSLSVSRRLACEAQETTSISPSPSLPVSLFPSFADWEWCFIDNNDVDFNWLCCLQGLLKLFAYQNWPGAIPTEIALSSHHPSSYHKSLWNSAIGCSLIP